MLSIIIPCFNEEDVIENTVNRIKYWCEFKGLDYQLIIVNNQSSDNTEKIAKQLIDNDVILTNQYKKGDLFFERIKR